jgi:hypothetical protein
MPTKKMGVSMFAQTFSRKLNWLRHLNIEHFSEEDNRKRKSLEGKNG